MSAKRLSTLSVAIALAMGASTVLAGGPDMHSSCSPALHTGFYIGAGPNYGFGTINSNWGTSTKIQLGSRGWGGQLFAGWDTVVLEHAYFGVNTFFTFNDVNTKGTLTNNVNGNVDLDYLWGFVFEPGYAPAANVHLFGRIGIANGWMELEDVLGTKNDFSHFGMLLGLGMEVGVGENWGIRGDYTYYSLGKETSGNPEAIVRPRYGIAALSAVYHF